MVKKVIGGRSEMDDAEKVAYQNVYWGRAYNWNPAPPGRVDDGLQGRLGRNAPPGCLRMIDTMGLNNIAQGTWFLGPNGVQGDAGTCTVAQWAAF